MICRSSDKFTAPGQHHSRATILTCIPSQLYYTGADEDADADEDDKDENGDGVYRDA